MHIPLLPSVPKTTSALVFLGALAALAACEGTTSDSCAPHGERHGDHCDCDDGFAPSEDGSTCVAEAGRDASSPDASTPDASAPDAEPEVTPETTTPDTSSLDGETTQPAPDAGPTDTAGPTSTVIDFTSITARTTLQTTDGGARFWILEAAAGQYVLSLQIYEDFGGPTAPGEFPITETETDYASCGTCLVLRDGCEAHGDHYHCDKTFMPEIGGSMTLTALGTRDGAPMSGTLEGLTFREVDIANNNNATTPVPSGARLSLSPWTFTSTVDKVGP